MNKIKRQIRRASVRTGYGGTKKVAKKRKSGGRKKGGSGKSKSVQCSKCGRIVPSDKAKKQTKRVSSVEPQLARELRRTGSFIPTKIVTQYYCVSCAVHTGKVQIRQASERRTVPERQRRY